MPKYKIPVTYTMYGYYEIEADNIVEAIDEVLDNSSAACQVLPPDAEYLTDSLRISEEDVRENNELNTEDEVDLSIHLEERFRMM